jgi:hypothetical protein
LFFSPWLTIRERDIIFYRPGKFIQTKIQMIHRPQRDFRQVHPVMMVIYPFSTDIDHIFFLIKCPIRFLK